jgi:P-type Cu2+ transporter
MAETLDLSLFVEPGDGGASHMTLAVEGVSCAGCIRKIEDGLNKLPGVIDARLNFTQRRLAVDWRNDETDAAEIITAIETIGYRARPFAPQRADADESAQAKRLMKCLAVAGFAAMNVMLLSVSVWAGNVSDMTQETRDLFHWLSALIALPAASYAGQPFFQSAFRALRARHVNMDVPISIGVTLALGLSVYETATHATHAYFDSAIMLLFFLLVGRYLDLAVRRKTRLFAGNLASIKAEFAHRLDASGELVQVPAAALYPGDRVLVRAGERVPADGAIINGSSEIDESLVTGETLYRPVRAGATIHAGSINVSGALTVRVTAVGASTLVGEVERLLDKATQARSQTVQLADRAARLYAPVVHTTAALTAVGWLVAGAGVHDSIVIAIAVLIITCPCAIALAIPAVQVVAAGALFRSGVILNGGGAIERLAAADTIVFDKTGTLTLPEPRVDESASIPPEILEKAARLALSSHHPLATALARLARVRSPYAGAVEQPGQGVRAVIDGKDARLGSASFCGIATDVRAPHGGDASFITFSHDGATVTIPIRQTLRPDAVAVVEALRKHARSHRAVRRPDRRRSPGRKRARNCKLASRAEAGAKNRPDRRAEGAGPSCFDGRRRIKRRPSACGCACLDVADHGGALDPGPSGRVVPGRSIEAGSAGGYDLAARPPPDEAKSGTGGDLQSVRCPAGNCRTGDAADRRGRHVGIVAAGHAERTARAPRHGSRPMNVLIYLVPLALMLGLTGLAAFLWSLKSGQYDDLDGAAVRILPDDDIASRHMASRREL